MVRTGSGSLRVSCGGEAKFWECATAVVWKMASGLLARRSFLLRRLFQNQEGCFNSTFTRRSSFPVITRNHPYFDGAGDENRTRVLSLGSTRNCTVRSNIVTDQTRRSDLPGGAPSDVGTSWHLGQPTYTVSMISLTDRENAG